MKKGLTELVFILDRSGSMDGLTEDTIGGFNGLLKKQKAKEGQAYVSTVLFNHESKVLHDRVELEKVPPMTREDYVAAGSTALLDALGDAIRHIGNVHKYAREEDVPEHTLFVITTDGMENASRRYTAREVRELIQRQKSRYGWEFLFLGANIDAVRTAEDYGISADRAVQFHNDSRGTELNYEAVCCAVSALRSDCAIPAGWKADIEADFQQRSES